MLQLFVVVSISMFVWKRDVLRAFISNVKVFRSLHFVAITAIGFIVLSQVEPKAFEVSGLFDLPLLVLPPLCMFLTWQFTAMVNDIYDVEIDQMVHPDRPLVTGRIGPSIYRNAAVVFAVLSILISLYLGLLLALLNLSFTAAAMMYSKPPIRLKERVYGYVCVGYASVVSFYFGVYSHISWTLSVQRGRWFLFEGLPFYREVVSISLIIFAALSIAPYINALSDYEGDKKSDVTNIYMICGRPKGKKIVSVLIVFLFTSPLLLFYSVLDLIILIPVSLFAAYIFYVHEDHRPIFSLYFLVIVYSILRYTGLF